ncbi:MAG: cytidylate kinase family protein [Bacteroidales bacterium]|nr:cytidylate kinase family protein [Bacteroidales bacterium]
MTADIKDRIARVRSQGSSKFKDLDTIDDVRLEELLNKGDRRRASYYGEYSLKTWGAAESYHLCLNSSLFGIEGCASIIEKFITDRFF